MKRFLVPTLAVCIALAGCKHEPSLVGSWDTELTAGGQKATSVVNFKADGTMESNASMAIMGQDLAFSMNGTYEVKEKNLSITVKDVAVQKAPEQFKAMIEEGMKKQTGKTQTGTITWEGEDKFTLAEGGKQQAFLRKK